MEVAQSADTVRLYATTDAKVWAEEFMKVVRSKWDGTRLPVNEGFMIGWFANAIETAKAHARNDGEV